MIIFLYGPDTCRSRQKLRELQERFITEEDKSGLNLQKFDAENFDLDRFRQAALSVPFLTKKKMVVLESIITESAKTQQNSKQLESLIQVLDRLPKSTVLVFWEGDCKSSGSGASLLRRLAQEKYVLEFDLLKGIKLRHWVEGEIKKRGGSILRRALCLLVDLVGSDLWRMSAEIGKLIAYKEGNQRPGNRVSKEVFKETRFPSSHITVDDINLLVHQEAEENIFRFIDALSVKNKKMAAKLLEEQIISGLTEGHILAMLSRQFRILIQVKDLAANRITKAELSQKLKLHPFVAQKTLVQVRNFELEELKNIYQKLLEIDVQIKSGYAKSRVLLDLFIANV